MAGGAPETLIASAARGAGTVNSGIVPIEKGELLNIAVTVTATSGTPSLATSLQWSHDGINLVNADGGGETMTAITGTPGTVKQFALKGPFVQVSTTVSGTSPNMTYSVTAYVTGAP